MDYLVYVLVMLARILVWGVLIAMLARSILSLFMIDEETRLGMFLYYVTEPITLPMRLLFERLGWFQNADVPIDFPSIFTFILLMMLSMLL